MLACSAFAQTATQAPASQSAAPPANPDIYYSLSPDALPMDGVPKGEIRGPFVLPSEAYPGTQHTYWVYVPAQYDPKTPASVMIYNDGQAFMAPEGMEVVGRDGVPVGCLKAVRGDAMLVDRVLRRDVYVPFEAIHTVTGEQIVLTIPGDAVEAMRWPHPSLL